MASGDCTLILVKLLTSILMVILVEFPYKLEICTGILINSGL